MLRRAGGGAFALVLALLWFTVAPVAGEPSPAAEDRFVALIAQERSEAGVAPCDLASDLVAVARNHAEDMAREGRVFHNPNLQSDVKNWDSVGENVGKGGSVDSIHAAFMDSKSHRDVMLSTKFTQVGVGVVERDGTLYVSQVFRRPSAPTTTASPPAATSTSAASRPTTTTARSPATTSARGPGASTSSSMGTSTTSSTTTSEPAAAPSTTEAGEGDGGALAGPAPAPARIDVPSPVREVTLPIGIAAAMLVAVVAGATGQAASDRRK